MLIRLRCLSGDAIQKVSRICLSLCVRRFTNSSRYSVAFRYLFSCALNAASTRTKNETSSFSISCHVWLDNMGESYA